MASVRHSPNLGGTVPSSAQSLNETTALDLLETRHSNEFIKKPPRQNVVVYPPLVSGCQSSAKGHVKKQPRGSQTTMDNSTHTLAVHSSGGPGYMIYREAQAGQPMDTSAPIQFFPPKETDELFNALKNAFPHLKTHSERLRDATIKFLLEEQQAIKDASSAPVLVPETSPPPAPAARTKEPTPPKKLKAWNHSTIGTKGKFRHTPHINPDGQSSSLVTKDMPPAEEMTGVFSISAVQPKQHQRRRMTEKEKSDYRRRRMTKACDQCAKRKRKCNHDLTETTSSEQEDFVRYSSAQSDRSISDIHEAAVEGPLQDVDMYNTNYASGLDLPSTQTMDDGSELTRESQKLWDMQNSNEFLALSFDPAPDSMDLDAWPTETTFDAHSWIPQDQAMTGLILDPLLAESGTPTLAANEQEQLSFPRTIPYSDGSARMKAAYEAGIRAGSTNVLPKENRSCNEAVSQTAMYAPSLRFCQQAHERATHNDNGSDTSDEAPSVVPYFRRDSGIRFGQASSCVASAYSTPKDPPEVEEVALDAESVVDFITWRWELLSSVASALVEKFAGPDQP